METMMFVLWFAVGFVFGSVPSGLWLVKAIHGIDIREYGSKNIGSTNVFRTVGGKTRRLCFCATLARALLRYDCPKHDRRRFVRHAVCRYRRAAGA